MTTQVHGLGDLDAYIADLGVAPARANKAVERVLNRAGLEMKKKMQADFQPSRSFGHIARSVTYDTDSRRVEVGPDAARSSSAPLAGIAYFGGARGGGGTVREPDYILADEAGTAAEWIGRELDGLP